MDLRKIVGLFALGLLALGISLVLLISSYRMTLAKEKSESLPCCSVADNLSDEDYARAIQKGLEAAKKQKGENS